MAHRRSIRLAALSAGAAAAITLAGTASASTVPPSSAPPETTTGDSGAGTTAASTPVGTIPDPADCMADMTTVSDNVLTIATGEPAFPPYMIDDDPTNQQGFESAVAYAVAGLLGFADDEVEWVRTPFDTVIAPGPKDFDFNLQQYTITDERLEVVDFSLPYYTAPQAILGYAGSPAASATSLADLQDLRIGVAAGTTAVPFVEDVIVPTESMQVFNDVASTKAALDANQIDAVVADLPTALYISAVEIEGSVVFGQFVAGGTAGDDFGLLFEQDNPLVECVDLALLTLRQSGELEAITTEWMVTGAEVPVIDIDG